MNARATLTAFATVLAAALASASLEDILAPLPPLEAPAETDAAEPSSKSAKPNSQASAPSAPAAKQRHVPITAEDVQEAISIALEDRLRPAGRLVLTPLRELADMSAYEQPFNLRIVMAPDRLLRGSIIVRYEIENDKGVLGEWTASFRIQVMREAWWANNQLRKGELASASDLVVKQVDVLLEPEAVPASLDSLVSREYNRDIAPGRPLIWTDLVERSLVRKGSVVEVVAKQGLLAISMRAIARQDGLAGDVIILRNIDSSKDFSARVVAEGRAEVIF